MNRKAVLVLVLLTAFGASAVAAFRQTKAVETGPTPVQWRKIIVDPVFRSEGVAIADVNRDGRKDVLVGDCWYEAPNWKRHDIRAPRTDLGDGAGTYSDVFCCFIGDYNHDGWPDVLVVGFPGKPGYWYENPGSTPGQEPPYWKRHPVTDSVCNETPNYVDLFGDGQKYLVAATGGKMCWFAPSRDLDTPWEQHVIGAPETAGGKAPGTEVFSHGLGFGDVNGDGRVDILVKQGWWEQPPDARASNAVPWTFHPANFGEDCSNLYAFDIDGDGLADVLSASAHGRGIWWFQQQKDGGFVRHLIADEFTETHSMNRATIAGGGSPDFVTGKRWWAHGPHGDVDPNAPPVLYWFEIKSHKGEAPQFIGHRIDDASGVGTQFVTDDINGDKRTDVIVSNKRGVFIFEQQ